MGCFMPVISEDATQISQQPLSVSNACIQQQNQQQIAINQQTRQMQPLNNQTQSFLNQPSCEPVVKCTQVHTIQKQPNEQPIQQPTEQSLNPQSQFQPQLFVPKKLPQDPKYEHLRQIVKSIVKENQQLQIEVEIPNSDETLKIYQEIYDTVLENNIAPVFSFAKSRTPPSTLFKVKFQTGARLPDFKQVVTLRGDDFYRINHLSPTLQTVYDLVVQRCVCCEPIVYIPLSLGLTKPQMTEVMDHVQKDHPEFWFLPLQNPFLANEAHILKITLFTQQKEDVIMKNRQFEETLLTTFNNVNCQDFVQFEKNCQIFLNQIEYVKVSGEPAHETAFGALQNRKSICSGIAGLFKILMNMRLTKCIRVSGTAWNGVSSQKESQQTQQWNAVQIGEKWTYVDPTWNRDTKWKYFNVGEQTILQNHTFRDKLGIIGVDM